MKIIICEFRTGKIVTPQIGSRQISCLIARCREQLWQTKSSKVKACAFDLRPG